VTSEEFPEEIELPIDGVLDLHAVHPREVKRLVPDYLEACLEQGIRQVRVIHGKGKGILRETVQSVLKKLAIVESFRPGGDGGGGWGATIVLLRDRPDQD
jgi:DNA-nicking Smr family endonuclease